MPRTAGKRELNKEANRAAILDAARRCFLEHGYETVTIRDVVRLSGLASGTFYNYFPDKESLLHALMQARLGAISERMHAARERAASIEDFLYEAYLTAFTEMCADPEFFAMMLRNEPAVRAIYNDNIMGMVMGSLKEDLQRAVARGLFPQINVEYLTTILFGAGYEMARLLIESPAAARKPREAALFTTRVFLNGVAVMAAAPTQMIRRGAITLKGTAR